ncbi:MAG: metallophosphoesterase [Gammaproteobacteria bacterium]|nr:metallophosphoesterase [Pseudomonadales bacterium]MCP5348104.1 metallophosphoesterase [Pseudomonadales bacterium]
MNELEQTSDTPGVEPGSARTGSGADVEDQWDGVERIIALGDLHGDYGGYMEALQLTGLVDGEGNWAGGSSHFVQIGDIPDRGPDSARIIRHLQKIEPQAIAAGGRVHALIGNHEVMNMVGQLQYVHPGEYQALRSDSAESLRAAFQQDIREGRDCQPVTSLYDYVSRRQRGQRQEVPLGYVEHRSCWGPEGEFGSWVAGNNTAIRLNNMLFVHAGISPRYLGWSLRKINTRIREELLDSERFSEPVSDDHRGPLWYRGLALEDEAVAPDFVDLLLETYGVEYVVIGHTPGYETIVPRYQGRVLVIDSGISSFFGGALTVLVMEDGKLFNLQRGRRIAIPDRPDELLDYFRTVAELEPASVSLRMLISTLEMRGPGQW